MTSLDQKKNVKNNIKNNDDKGFFKTFQLPREILLVQIF